MTNLTFILFLLIGYIFFCLSIIKNNKNTEVILRFLFIIFFSFIAAFRFSTVPDTEVYIKHYNDIASLSFSDFGFYHFEPGYVCLVKLYCKLLGGSCHNFFFFLTFINLIIVSHSFNILYKKQYSLINISLLFFISYYGLYFNFIVLRFGIGASFFLCSLAYIKHKKIYSILFYALSIFCHTSFFLIFPIYIIMLMYNNCKQKIFFYIWLLVIGIIYYFRIGRFLTNSLIQIIILILKKIFLNYTYYFENLDFGNEKISIRFTLNYILGFIFIRYGYIKNKTYLINLIIYLVGLSIYSFFSAIELIDRISDIYLLSGIFLISNYFSSLKNIRDKLILFYPICILNAIFAIRIINR